MFTSGGRWITLMVLCGISSSKEENFVIIFTHCSPRALEENLEDMRVAFKGCARHITVDFPTANEPESSTIVWARRNDKMRLGSIERLRKLLAEYMLPVRENLCLRSNLKKGRILLMGSDTRARNMVAKLLVNGTLKISSSASCSGTDSTTTDLSKMHGNEKSFEELEGRRWQVVNALLFEKESIGDIYMDKYTTTAAVTEAVTKAATKAVTLLASKFLTILRHGG